MYTMIVNISLMPVQFDFHIHKNKHLTQIFEERQIMK